MILREKWKRVKNLKYNKSIPETLRSLGLMLVEIILIFTVEPIVNKIIKIIECKMERM